MVCALMDQDNGASMQLSDILLPEAVRTLGNVTSKKRLFQNLAEIAARVYDVRQDKVAAALQAREVLGPTGVGDGVALPHARLPDLGRIAGVFVRLETPIDFDAADRRSVDLVFCLLAPEQGGIEHLKALALVARSFRDAALRSKLRANPDPPLLHMILTETSSIWAA